MNTTEAAVIPEQSPPRSSIRTSPQRLRRPRLPPKERAWQQAQ